MDYQLFTYSGIPRENDKVSVSINDSNGGSKTVTYTVTSGGTTASVVSSLVGLISDANYTAVPFNSVALYVKSNFGYEVTGESTIELLGNHSLTPYSWSFNEKRNSYCSFYSYHPEWITSAQDVIYTWNNGQLYAHNNTAQHSNFFGVQYDASITLVFNINLLEKKTWESLTEIASAIWACPLIYSNVMSYGSQRQESELGEFDFKAMESNFHTAFLRDVHSIKGLLNGDIIKGNWLAIKFIKTNASDKISLSEVSVMFKDSPLTNK